MRERENAEGSTSNQRGGNAIKLPPTARAMHRSTMLSVTRTLSQTTAAIPPCAVSYPGLMQMSIKLVLLLNMLD